MTENLNKAKSLLLSQDYTCVLFNGKNVLCSKKRGVQPLIEFLESECDLGGYSAADKVVGAGAAHLYTLMGIKSIWAMVISDSAKEILERNNITVLFEMQVPYIINRTKDGMCPIENCVKGIKDSTEAFNTIKKKLQELL